MNKSCRFIVFIYVLMVAWSWAEVSKSEGASSSKPWPAQLLVDDFEKGLDRWEHQDEGQLSLSRDAAQGRQSLRWVAGDDGLGRIVLKNLKKSEIDFKQYDLLQLKIKVSGKNIWNINPVIQQHPHAYGFRALYWSVDTLYPFDEWYTLTIDLNNWENAWASSFSKEAQEFQFEIHQMAGEEKTEVYLDDIRLIKNPIGLPVSIHPVAHAVLSETKQVWTYEVPLSNKGEDPLRLATDVDFSAATGRHHLKLISENAQPIHLKVGEQRLWRFQVVSSGGLEEQAFQLQTAVAKVRMDALNLELTSKLHFAPSSKTQNAPWQHPSIFCQSDDLKALRDHIDQTPSKGKISPTQKFAKQLKKQAEAIVSSHHEYPPLAATGFTRAPSSTDAGQHGAKLVEIDVPNLPFKSYQDPETGITYSGPLFDAGMQGYLQKHLKNAADVRTLGMAYLMHKDERFARKAASIIKGYINTYLALPITSIAQGSPTRSLSSGGTRIGGTFMRERVWLTNLAQGLDSILPAGVISPKDLENIRLKVFVPSATRMLNHHVGVMNLQFMIQSAVLYAGLACEDATLVGRAVYSDHGIVRLMERGFLPEGCWWENPSYQNVSKLAALPAISTCTLNGILPYTTQIDDIILSTYKLHAPDSRSPSLGTGGWANHRVSEQGAFLFGNASKNPQVNWILHSSKPKSGTYGVGDMAVFRARPSKLAKEDTENPFAKSSFHFPHYGGIAMRLPDSDRYCYFNYGRELVHGHRNKLSVQAYGKGAWTSRNVMGGYAHNFKDFLETMATANSIVVDEKNADLDTGELLFIKNTDDLAMASARELGAYKDVEHERSVVLTSGPVIVVDRLIGDGKTQHSFDLFYHPSNIELSLQTPFEPSSGLLSEASMYSGFELQGSFTGRKIRYERLKHKKKSMLGTGAVFCAGPEGELFSLQVKDTYRPHTSVIWRKSGLHATFIHAIWPFDAAQGDGDEAKLDIQALPLETPHDEKGAVLAQAYRVSSAEGAWTVIVNYSHEPLSFEGQTFRDRVSVVSHKP